LAEKQAKGENSAPISQQAGKRPQFPPSMGRYIQKLESETLGSSVIFLSLRIGDQHQKNLALAT
jgi:hypothetical protein